MLLTRDTYQSVFSVKPSSIAGKSVSFGVATSPTLRSRPNSNDSEGFVPLDWKNLIPLSLLGLWEAVTAQPAKAFPNSTTLAIAGVGTTPIDSMAPPSDLNPAPNAATRFRPDARVSLPTTMSGASISCCCFNSRAMATPARKAMPSLRLGPPYSPRIPSVPKYLRAITICRIPSPLRFSSGRCHLSTGPGLPRPLPQYSRNVPSRKKPQQH